MKGLRAIARRASRSRGDAGVSLAELLVVSLVSTILLAALGTLVASSLAASRETAARTSATAEARQAMDVVARRLRVAVRPPSGSPMITQASANVIDFYASLGTPDPMVDPVPSRVRYQVDPVRKCLLETVTPNAGAGTPRSLCLAYGDVAPTFRYYQVTKPVTSSNPTPSVAPTAELVPPTGGALAAPDVVASVEVQLQVRDVRQPQDVIEVKTRVLMVNHHNEQVS